MHKCLHPFGTISLHNGTSNSFTLQAHRTCKGTSGSKDPHFYNLLLHVESFDLVPRGSIDGTGVNYDSSKWITRGATRLAARANFFS